MLHHFALSIGESFAELLGYGAVSSQSPSRATYRSRWYLPRRSLSDGLLEAFKSIPAGDKVELSIATYAVERILSNRQGRSPGFLVSSGYEGWAPLLNSTKTPRFSIHPVRGESAPVDEDFVFGLGGRINASGKESSPLAQDDLAQVMAKLELLEIKDIAISLANSHLNPSHEAETARALREKGFRVFASTEDRSLVDVMDPAHRARRSLENAFAESAVREEKVQIENAIKTSERDCQVRVWTNSGLENGMEAYSSIRVRDGIGMALRAARIGKSPHLHLGLDGFKLLGDSDTCVELKPTSLVGHGDWPFPIFTHEDASYAPGPMLFGKSHYLTALDVFHLCESLVEIEGFSNLISDKSKARISEKLLAVAKSAEPGKRPPEPIDVAQMLQTSFIEELAATLALAGAEGEIALTGPLAKTLQPLLKERRTDLKFKTYEDSEFYEAQSVRGGALK